MVGHECGFRLGQLLVCGRERASSAGGPREPGVCRAGTPRGADPGRRQLRLYFQRPVTLAFPRVLELQEKQGPVRQDEGQPSTVGRWGAWGAAEG